MLLRRTDQDSCTGRMVGYQPALEMARIENTGFSTAASNTADGLTDVMVLHPIACGVAFIAFLVSLGAGIIGSFVGAIIAFIAFLISLLAMVCDFVLWGVCRPTPSVLPQGGFAKQTY